MNLKRTPYSRFTVVGLTTAVSLTLLLSGCGASPTANNTVPSIVSGQKIKLIAAENFYGELAIAVGGDRVEVTSIIDNPDADPHDYEPTADTSKLVNDAKVILYNGIGYDEWMAKVLTSSSNSKDKSIIAVGSDVLGKKDGDNPHIWYDPSAMLKLADSLADKLSQIDPSQADAYKKRAAEYKTSLAPLTELVKVIKQSSQVEIAVSEPVFDYMSGALNFKSIDPKFAKAIEEGTDPSPGDVADLQTAIKGKTIKLFVQNTQADSPTVKNMVDMAKVNQIPIVQVTETEPKGKSYVQWMTDQLKQVKDALSL
ncbi:MAG: Zinc/manganese transport system substrate-binding protein [Bacilli bacterium]|nr:Zinc/manganese transport system substrate-binding protein [Bacilli bacterium]